VTIVAVLGDCTTTTCVALAATWPIADPLADTVIVLEADPSGGSLAAWLDTPVSPTLGTIVATVGSDSAIESVCRTVATMTHRSGSGIRFVAAPVRAVAARRAVDEATRRVFPAIAATTDIVAIADIGNPYSADSRISSIAAATIVVHRQERASAPAEAVRLERLIELVGQHPGSTLAIVGDDPFDPTEIVRFVEESVPGAAAASVTLADDALAAAVLAGRRGVSAARLRRLPLMRSASVAALQLSTVFTARSTQVSAP